MAKNLYLIDGSSYFFRAFYAIGHLSNQEGLPTNATFGFTNMLLRVVNEKKPDYLGMVFDPKGPTFRKNIYAEYKANRAAMPEDLAIQIPYIKEVVRAYRIPILEVADVEADDVIATMVERFKSETDLNIVIVSGDKDLMQLVSDRVTMLDTMRDRLFGRLEVLEKFGVPPEQVGEVLAIAGDASDNIPGIPGMGIKTAAKLIAQYHTLDNLIAHASELKGKMKERVELHADQAQLSKKLVTLKHDVVIDCDLVGLTRNEANYDHLRELFKKLNFGKLLDALPKNGGTGSLHLSASSQPKLLRDQYQLMIDAQQLQSWVAHIQATKQPVSVDLETSSLNPMAAEIVGIGLCAQAGLAYYIPIGHLEDHPQMPLTTALSLIKPLLENPQVPKWGQNIKYDDVILRRHGVCIANIGFDSMLASYLLESAQRAGHNLDVLAQRYLGHTCISFSEAVADTNNQLFAEVPLSKALDYAGEDVDVVLQLQGPMMTEIGKMGLQSVLNDLELPLSSILAQMEHVGVYVNPEKLRDLSQVFAVELAQLTENIYDLAGEKFSINSPKQLQKILFEKLNLPASKKIKTGFSTDTAVLQSLVGLHELPNYLLRYRLLSKLKSTYLDSLPNLIDPHTRRIHTTYQQAVAATGRLSSSGPNLQNIPIRGGEGQLIRQAFEGQGGLQLLGADYSQIELRLFAHFSGDPQLIQAYEADRDIHSLTAQNIFSCPADQVTAEMRRRAKTINFGILYGMSEFRLSGELGISRVEAKIFLANYFKQFPQIKNFIDETIARAREQGFVQTFSGRRREVRDLNSKNFNLRRAAERIAVSTPIQGSAADLIKKAMVNIDRRMKREQLQSRLIMQVHDELVFEVLPAEIVAMKALVQEEMENAWPLKVPLKVQVATGENWLAIH